MGRILTNEIADVTAEEPEFTLTDKDFKYIQWFIHKNVGIFLADHKRAMVYGRISRRLREKGLREFSEYRKCIEANAEDRMAFINSLTTNKTHFFREGHHFEFIEQKMAPYWRDTQKRDIRIWSAGCSTGEEAYSFLASLNYCGVLRQHHVAMLATDIDTKVLAKARVGIYDDECLESIPPKYRKGNFVKGKNQQKGKVKVSRLLQEFITFNQLNLLQPWPMKKQFDVISCRNVMIYFDKPTQEKLFSRFHQQLADDGILLIGHSESVPVNSKMFKHLGKTIYIKDK